MKKITVLFLAIAAVVIVSCKSEDSDEVCCWKFNVTTINSMDSEYTNTKDTIYTNVERCGLTESQAKDAAKEMEGTVTETTQDLTTSITTTVDYEKVAE